MEQVFDKAVDLLNTADMEFKYIFVFAFFLHNHQSTLRARNITAVCLHGAFFFISNMFEYKTYVK